MAVESLIAANLMETRRRWMLFWLGAAASARAELETFEQWIAARSEQRKEALAHCLRRIAELDPALQAWVQVAPREPTGQGPLSGIPFGAKDVFETAGLATEYGSRVYKGRLGVRDAEIVSHLRSRGAVLLGKTHTTGFAYRAPGPTRNPRNPAHTPGGSSSGSAAAVAAGMVPFALGTQTGGSVLRPASFCGITGFKPTYGLIPTGGLMPLARSLDTVGFFTHTASSMAALWKSMGHTLGRHGEFAAGVPDPPLDADPGMAAAFHRAVSTLRTARIAIHALALRPVLDDLTAAAQIIMLFEGAREHHHRFLEHGDRLDAIADLVRDGLKISDAQYEAARNRIQSGRGRLAELFRKTPIILTPAAPGPPPLGLASTGDPRMNRPWTALGVPAISIPMPVGPALPLGLQLTAARGHDSLVLAAAIRFEKLLAAHG